MKLTRLKINGIPTPLGYTFDTPTLSWNVEEAQGKQLKDVQIKVATDPNFEHLVFETSGSDLSCTGTALAFSLEPRSRYYVQLQVTDDAHDSTTENTWFETGKSTEHWDANWIAPQKTDTFHPVFHKTFLCSDSTFHQLPSSSMATDKKQVQSARLYICGLGVYEAYLNGEKIGNELLTPYLNDYRFALQTQTYDVTNILHAGTNHLEVYLGNGWYKGRFGQIGKTYGDRFALIAELHLHYADGSSDVIKTDDSWKYCGSDIEDSGIYDGEILNRLKWSTTGNEWKSVEFIDIDKSLLVDRHSLPVRLCLSKRFSIPRLARLYLIWGRIFPVGLYFKIINQAAQNFILNLVKFCRTVISTTTIIAVPKGDSPTFPMANPNWYVHILLTLVSAMSKLPAGLVL